MLFEKWGEGGLPKSKTKLLIQRQFLQCQCEGHRLRCQTHARQPHASCETLCGSRPQHYPFRQQATCYFCLRDTFSFNSTFQNFLLSGSLQEIGNINSVKRQRKESKDRGRDLKRSFLGTPSSAQSLLSLKHVNTE